MRIAIIFCCYNRKGLTKRCLVQLSRQAAQFEEDTFEIYVCDDDSTDGTVEMIEKEFQWVHLLKNGGNLYWCKSMHKGMREAVKEDYDYYLMVNDDVDFAEDALKVMLQSYEMAAKPCAIVGATKTNEKDCVSYGGRDKNGMLMVPDGTLKSCELANWNCFLVDKGIISKVGIIDGKYQHAWGDFDYSYRMRRMNYPIYLATDYIGKCDTNSVTGTFRDKSLGRRKQLKKLFSTKGMPFYSYMRYHLKTQGKWRLFKYLYGYLSMIGYILLKKEMK